MIKLKAIWLILTNNCWFLAVSKNGKVGDSVRVAGVYTGCMGDTIVCHIAETMQNYQLQEDAVDEVKNIINGTL